MKLYSTSGKSDDVNLKTAVLNGQAADGGLYMPRQIPKLEDDVIRSFPDLSFNELALHVAEKLFTDEVAIADLKQIIDSAYDFVPEIKSMNENLSFLELFHGPTLAFKDFGARFMARLMSHYCQADKQELTILVATSGDTGSAVASAFYNVPGIKVIILYPSKKVSPLQELQLTTWGGNITALEVLGTFDDCQKAVKQCFQDQELKQTLNLTSANSINIARLIPQSFYYFYAQSQLSLAESAKKDLVFCVPSGNFGNLTAGLIANQMGMPAKNFIAATNLNKVVPDYLQSGLFEAKKSVQTISNAMDVGNPSNLVRIQHLYQQDIAKMRSMIKAYYYDDQQTKASLEQVYREYNYLICPHTAVGHLAARDYQKNYGEDNHIIVLSTAHPAKFQSEVESVIGNKVSLPTALEEISQKEKSSLLIEKDYQNIRNNIASLS